MPTKFLLLLSALFAAALQQELLLSGWHNYTQNTISPKCIYDASVVNFYIIFYTIKCEEYVYLQPEDEILAQKYTEEGVTDLRPESDRLRNFFDSDAFEGDMLFFDEVNVNGITKLMKAKFVSAGRHAENKWPKGIIPYKIASDLSSKLKALFSMAIKIIQNVSCVKFIPSFQYKEDSHRNISPFIIKPSPEGLCLTTIGLNDSRPDNTMQMAPGCAELSTMLHELLHCLGFVHEQCRDDRDNFIQVLWDNVPNKKHRNFLKYLYPFERYTPYDYESIMHYKETAFSIDDRTKKSMVSSRANHKITDNRELSKWDIIKVNKHYNCGMEFKKCKDRLPTSQCRRIGLGKISEINWDPDKAKCVDKYWARKYCAFTCSYCYKFLKVQKRPRIRRSIIGPMTFIDYCIRSRESLYDKSDAAHCVMWRNNGLCQTYSSFMQQNCAKTCKQC